MNGIRRARKAVGGGAAAGMLALLMSCGGDGGSGPNGGDANFTATIDGNDFTASAATTVAQISNAGNFAIVGSSGTSTATSITLILYNIGGPGTYPLGVSGTARGGLGTVGTSSSSLSTPLSGTAGSVTISQVSATRIAGTFNFVAGVAPVTKTVTDGSFDLPVTGNGSINVPDFAGSRVDGTINGTPWNAAAVVMVAAPSSGTLGVGFSNLTYQMNLIISGWTGVGTYTMNSGVSRQMTVMATDGSLRLWGGSGGLTTGTFTVVTATATRISGNYDITLQPAAIGQAAGNLHLVGTFDIGIQP
jgi:hypothetical protein